MAIDSSEVLRILDRLTTLYDATRIPSARLTMQQLAKGGRGSHPWAAIYGVDEYLPLYQQEVKDIGQTLACAAAERGVDSTAFDNLLVVSDRLTSAVAAAAQKLRTHVLAEDAAPNGKQPASDTEQQMERLAQVIGDDNAVKVLGIAQRTDIGGEEKLREIVKIDIRFKGKKSEELAGMLGVSDAAVRGYDIWKEWRAEQKSLS